MTGDKVDTYCVLADGGVSVEQDEVLDTTMAPGQDHVSPEIATRVETSAVSASCRVNGQVFRENVHCLRESWELLPITGKLLHSIISKNI